MKNLPLFSPFEKSEFPLKIDSLQMNKFGLLEMKEVVRCYQRQDRKSLGGPWEEKNCVLLRHPFIIHPFYFILVLHCFPRIE